VVSLAQGVAKRGTKAAARKLIEGGCDLRVSCVRFSPNPANPVIVSAGWDKVVKVSVVVWSLPSRFLFRFSRPPFDPMPKGMRHDTFRHARHPRHLDFMMTRYIFATSEG
jgi:hypothetical protein